jgi:hypothetical protein
MCFHVDQLLLTNHPLSQTERQVFTKAVSDGESSIRGIDAEMTRLESLLDTHIRQVQKYRAALSHARLLPPEIVSMIFMFCHDRPTIRHTLCQICSTWRNIATSTHSLWTDVSISMDRSKFGNQMSLLQVICERSGPLPLSIELTSGHHLSENQNPITTLTPYLPRVHRLSLAISRDCFHSLSALSAVRLPLLEIFCLNVGLPIKYRSSVAVIRTEPISLLENAHCLYNMDITGLIGDLGLLRFPSQLTRLSMASKITSDHCLDVLLQYPNLESLSRVVLAEDPLKDPHRGVLLLPRLGNLVLKSCQDRNLTDIFDHLTLPSLTNLDLMFAYLATWPHLSFISLLTRSSCNLLTLTFRYVEMSPLELLECLRALPSLVYLHLECVACLEGLTLSALTVVGGSQIVVPKLQYFLAHSLSIIPNQVTNELFVNMVESRWWPDADAVGPDIPSRQVARLRQAHLSYEDSEPLYVNEHTLQRIRRCSEEGLDISLRGV